MRLLCALLFVCTAAASPLQISRPVRSWEFVDAVGPHAALLGNEQGTLEAYVFPLKIFHELRLVFVSDGREIPGSAIARRVIARPGSFSIVYSFDDFRVTETLCAPLHVSGAIIHLDVDAKNPVRIDVHFKRDFQLMWPASFGSAYGEWNEQEEAFRLGADGQPYAALLGSPDAELLSREYATNYVSTAESAFTLGTIKGHADRVIAVAGSVKSAAEASAAFHDLTAAPRNLIAQTEDEYEGYLAKTVSVQLPDRELQDAYDWSRLSVIKAFVENPFLGTGMVAGFGPSKGAYRPGFGWFFGRDSFWTSFALSAAGDMQHAKEAIEFVAKFQRDDGKIPHEIPQSASLVPWFKQYVYGYNAADAGPLFITAVRDYVQASGDLAFAREQEPRIVKALEFMHSTLDPAGFPKNIDVGPGWVEGGPLLPVRLEIYQAGCYVESLRSAAWLARVTNDDARARELESEYQKKREDLNRIFWLPQQHSYAFALNTEGKPVEEQSVLATVPMWFGLLDTPHAQQMIQSLSREDHAADWGMRIISSRSPIYDPSGYHYGSVWPLFTGWASVGEYRYHQPEPAFANLLANASLTIAGAGNTTEVLSGETATPLSTASPHQTWSAAMVVSPLLRGLAGLETDALNHTVRFTPHLPATWDTFGVTGVPVGASKVDLQIRRDRDVLELTVSNSGSHAVGVDFAPSYPPCARVDSATVDGAPVQWKTEKQPNDWHPAFRVSAHPGKTKLVIKHSGLFGYTIPFAAPKLAEPSSNLKLIAENWSVDSRRLTLTTSGLSGQQYTIALSGADRIQSVSGASRQGSALVLKMNSGRLGEYVTQDVVVQLQ